MRGTTYMELKLDRLKVPLGFFILTVFLVAVTVFCASDRDAAADPRDHTVIVEAAGPEATATVG